MSDDTEKPELSALVPHRSPMMLLDEVESFSESERALVAKVSITPRSAFFEEGAEEGVPSWVAIEYMAQAAAALAGRFDLLANPDVPPRPGLLLGTRRMSLEIPRFRNGATYRVRAVNEYEDSDAAAFNCCITDDAGRTVATATLNAYRPPNFSEFLNSVSKGS